MEDFCGANLSCATKFSNGLKVWGKLLTEAIGFESTPSITWKASLSTIPDEILCEILFFLHSDSLCKFNSVNRKCHDASMFAAHYMCLTWRREKSVLPAYDCPMWHSWSSIRSLKNFELNSIMVLAGGPHEDPVRSDAYIFNTDTLQWKHISSGRACDTPPLCSSSFVRSAEFETVYHKGRLMMFADCDASKKRILGQRMECFDFKSKTWSTNKWSEELDVYYASGLISWHGRVLVTGGHMTTQDQRNKLTDRMFVIEEDRDASIGYYLRRLPSTMLSTRSHHGCVIYNNDLWIAGGQLSSHEYTNTTEIFKSLDGVNGFWVRGPPMQKVRDGCPRMAVIDGRLFAIGGDFDVHDDLRSTIECLDDERWRWQVVGKFKEPRIFSSVAVVGHKVYIFGGCVPEISDDVNYLNTYDVFDARTLTWESDWHPEFDYMFAGRMPHRTEGFAWCKTETIPCSLI